MEGTWCEAKWIEVAILLQPRITKDPHLQIHTNNLTHVLSPTILFPIFTPSTSSGCAASTPKGNLRSSGVLSFRRRSVKTFWLRVIDLNYGRFNFSILQERCKFQDIPPAVASGVAYCWDQIFYKDCLSIYHTIVTECIAQPFREKEWIWSCMISFLLVLQFRLCIKNSKITNLTPWKTSPTKGSPEIFSPVVKKEFHLNQTFMFIHFWNSTC